MGSQDLKQAAPAGVLLQECICRSASAGCTPPLEKNLWGVLEAVFASTPTMRNVLAQFFRPPDGIPAPALIQCFAKGPCHRKCLDFASFLKHFGQGCPATSGAPAAHFAELPGRLAAPPRKQIYFPLDFA